MLKYIIFLFMIIGVFLMGISCVVNADSCVISDELVNALSKKYEQLVTISKVTLKQNSLIKASAPLVLDGHRLQDILLVNGEIESPDLVVPLEWKEKAGEANAWYSGSESVTRTHIIVFNFGECGIELRYSVNN